MWASNCTPHHQEQDVPDRLFPLPLIGSINDKSVPFDQSACCSYGILIDTYLYIIGWSPP